MDGDKSNDPSFLYAFEPKFPGEKLYVRHGSPSARLPLDAQLRHLKTEEAELDDALDLYTTGILAHQPGLMSEVGGKEMGSKDVIEALKEGLIRVRADLVVVENKMSEEGNGHTKCCACL